MPDDLHDERRTIGEAFRLITDTRDQCARRAERHVDLDLYASERETLRRDLGQLGESQAQLWQAFKDHMNDQRQWRNRMMLAVLTAFVGPVLSAVFLFILLEVGGAG